MLPLRAAAGAGAGAPPFFFSFPNDCDCCAATASDIRRIPSGAPPPALDGIAPEQDDRRFLPASGEASRRLPASIEGRLSGSCGAMRAPRSDGARSLRNEFVLRS